MKSAQIIAGCILTCVGYGIVHDNITARLCVEYFTIGHPPIFGTEDPTLLALGWGIIATWWVGAMLGIMISMAARAGSWPKMEPNEFVRPILLLVGISTVCAALAGIVGYIAAVNQWVWLMPHLADRIPEEKQIWFLVDLWIHGASYLAGLVGGLVITGYAVQQRRRRRIVASATHGHM